MSNRNAELAARRAYEVEGYTLYLSRPDIGVEIYTAPAGAGGVLAKCFIGKAGKPAWFYRLTDEQLAGKADRVVRSRKVDLDAKAAARKAEQDALVPVAVGDVFRCSWGYDQTNVDYYQVTKVVGPKTIQVRKIAAMSWETEFMQGRSVPATDEFIGPPMTKRVRPCGLDGGAAIRITSFADAYRMEPVIEGTPIYESTGWTSYA